MQLPLEARSKLKTSLAELRLGGVVALYERLRRLKQTVPFVFVTEKVGSMVRVTPLGISSPGGIATLVSIAPGKGVTVKFQISKTEQLVHPSRIGTAVCNSQLFASALRSTRSVSSGARNTPPRTRAPRAPSLLSREEPRREGGEGAWAGPALPDHREAVGVLVEAPPRWSV